MALFLDLKHLFSYILLSCHTVTTSLNHACYDEMIENISGTLDSLSKLMEKKKGEDASLIRYQLLPFIEELSEKVYFWGLIYPDQEKMEVYYENEFVPHQSNPYLRSEKPKYLISLLKKFYLRKAIILCLNMILSVS